MRRGETAASVRQAIGGSSSDGDIFSRKLELQVILQNMTRKSNLCYIFLSNFSLQYETGEFHTSCYSTLRKGKGRPKSTGTYTWYSASSYWITAAEALRYGTCSQGIVPVLPAHPHNPPTRSSAVHDLSTWVQLNHQFIVADWIDGFRCFSVSMKRWKSNHCLPRGGGGALDAIASDQSSPGITLIQNTLYHMWE